MCQTRRNFYYINVSEQQQCVAYHLIKRFVCSVLSPLPHNKPLDRLFIINLLSTDLLAKLKSTPSNGTADATADQGDGLHQRRRPTAPSSPKADNHEADYTKEQLEIVTKIKK